MNTNTQVWLQFMYENGKDFGFDIIQDNPDISSIALESEIYNYLISQDEYRNYHQLVDAKAKQAAERVFYVQQQKLMKKS